MRHPAGLNFESKYWHGTSLTHYGPVMPYGDTELCQPWHFMPDGTKTLPELMLTNHQWGLVSSESNFTGNTPNIYLWYEFENSWFMIAATSPRGQWVKYVYKGLVGVRCASAIHPLTFVMNNSIQLIITLWYLLMYDSNFHVKYSTDIDGSIVNSFLLHTETFLSQPFK